MLLQSPNFVSHGGAGQGEEENLLPHFGHTACSVALSIEKLLYDEQRRSRSEVNEEVGRVRRLRKYGCHAINVGREVRPCAANSNNGLDLLKPIAAKVCMSPVSEVQILMQGDAMRAQGRLPGP